MQQKVAHPDPTATRPRPTPGAVRTLLDLSRAYPGRFGDNLRSPYPRAAVETFLEVFSRSSLTWADLPSLRSMTSLPILVKGLLSADDADRALDAGVDGIVVSNHGGRQVDSALAALDALPGVVDRVDGRVPVLMDSGIRSGADIVTALALGAAAVCVGRPYVYGLALAGADGVRAVLEHLLAELDLTMALSGVTSVAEITRDLAGPVPALTAGGSLTAVRDRLRRPGAGHADGRRVAACQRRKRSWVPAAHGQGPGTTRGGTRTVDCVLAPPLRRRTGWCYSCVPAVSSTGGASGSAAFCSPTKVKVSSSPSPSVPTSTI